MKAPIEVRYPTFREFQQYLRELNADDPLAPFCRSGRCPIDQWAQDNLMLPRGVRVRTTFGCMRAFNTAESYPNKVVASVDLDDDNEWVEQFINRIDAIDEGNWAALRPRHALIVLNQIGREISERNG